jgi:hypothetical protein
MSIKVVSEQRKARAELFDLLAAVMGPSQVLLSANSEWVKENGDHSFVELLSFVCKV